MLNHVCRRPQEDFIHLLEALIKLNQAGPLNIMRSKEGVSFWENVNIYVRAVCTFITLRLCPFLLKQP